MEAEFVIKESPKLSRNNQKRFVVEEIETGKVVLDANGYGYKNPGNNKHCYSGRVCWTGHPEKPSELLSNK